jgi:hypothetical protein
MVSPSLESGMTINQHTAHLGKAFGPLTVLGFGLLVPLALKADMVLQQSGAVVSGRVLQQDGNGVLMQNSGVVG